MRRLRDYIGAGIIPWLGFAAVTGSGFCLALLVLNPPLRTPREALLLLAYLLAYHALLFAAPALGVCGGLALLARRRVPLRRGQLAVFLVTMLAAVGLALNTGLRFSISYIMFRGVGPFALLRDTEPLLVPLGAWNLAFLTGALGLVFVCLWFALVAPPAQGRVPSSRQKKALGLGVALAVAYAATLFLNLESERPRVPELRTLPGIARQEESASVAPNREASEESEERKVLLIGLDGLSWFVVDAMIEGGDLPHLKQLIQRGTRAALHSQVPTISPSIWTTVATGRTARDHGIAGFSHFRLPGMRQWLDRGPLLATMNWWNALNRFLTVAGGRGWIEQSPFFSTHRKVASVWDVAAREGMSVGVVKWYSTWPVTKVGPGSYAVSDFSGRDGSIQPAEAASLASSEEVPRPGGFTRSSPLWRDPALARRSARAHESVMRGLEFYARFRPQLALHYSHFTDAVQHLYWRGEGATARRSGGGGQRHFSRAVRDSYSLADRWVGAFVAESDPQTVVIVMSDHGFSFDGHEHHQAPDGVLVIAGPGIRREYLLADASLLDIAPTILALLDLPISEELPGRVLESAFEPGSLGQPLRVSDYGWFEPGALEVQRSQAVEEEFLEQMKALGYVN